MCSSSVLIFRKVQLGAEGKLICMVQAQQVWGRWEERRQGNGGHPGRAGCSGFRSPAWQCLVWMSWFSVSLNWVLKRDLLSVRIRGCFMCLCVVRVCMCVLVHVYSVWVHMCPPSAYECWHVCGGKCLCRSFCVVWIETASLLLSD